MGWFQIIAAVISAILTLFTVGHGQRVVSGDGSFTDMGVTAGTGAVSLLLLWLSGLLQKILKPTPTPVPGPVDPNVPVDPKVLPSNLPLEFAQAIAALFALFKSPKDWALQKAAIVQCLEVVYVIAAATIKDPTFLALITQAMQVAEEQFAAVAPKTALGQIKASSSGVPTFAELLDR